MLALALAAFLQAAPPVSADGALRLSGVSLSLESIRRDDGVACETRSTRVVRVGPRVSVERACDIEEVWTEVNGGLEHELFVARAPGTGALRLRLRVDGPWHHADANGHVFAGPGADDGWTYGEAFVLTSTRERAHIDVVRTENGLELIIPAALVRFPLHIDPLVFPRAQRIVDTPSPFMGLPSESDEGNPSVAWNTNASYGVVVHSDDRRGLAPDLFGLVASFDAGFVLTNLVPFPAAQLRPAVLATRDGGLAIAFEDYGSGLTTPSVVVGIVDDEVNPDGRRPPRAVPNARAPSLSFDPQVGVVVGYSKTVSPTQTTLEVRAVEVFLADGGGVLLSVDVDGGLVERTSVASREGKRAIAAEFVNRRVRLFYEDNEVQLPQSAAGTVAQTSPSVVITEIGERYIAWSESALLPINDSVQVRRFDNSGQSVQSNFPQESQAALVSYNGRVLLLSFGPPSTMAARRELMVHDLTLGTTLGAYGFGRSGGLGELSADSRGFQILVGWTDRTLLEGRNLNLAMLRGIPDAGFEPKFFTRDGVPAQHDVRVAFRDDLGLVVWREASNAIRAQWINRLGETVVGSFTIADAAALVRFDGLDVAVGDNDALIAIRAFQADGRARILTFTVPRGQASFTPSLMADLAQTERPPPPQVAYTGASYFVGTALAAGYQLAEINGGTTSTRFFPTSATSFDLDCMDGHCALVWVDPVSQQVLLRRDLTMPDDITPLGRPGPVSLTNDGEKFYVHWQGQDPTGVASAALFSASFAPGDMTTTFATTPLVSDGGAFIASTIDAAGTQPPVVAVTDSNAHTWLVELGSRPPWRVFDSTANPRAVATSKKSSTGVVVFEQFGARQVTEAFVFPWEFDGGLAVGNDGGVANGGMDAGVFMLTSTSCGSCSSAGGGSSSAGWLFGVLAFAALFARRARKRGAWVALFVLVGAGVANAQIAVVSDVQLFDARPGGRLPNEGYAPTIASAPDGGPAVVAWVDTRRGDEDIFGMRINGGDAGAAKHLAFAPTAQTQPGLAMESSGSFVLAWQEFQGNTPVVRVARMNPQTLQVMMPGGTRPQARAPSVFSDRGVVWVCFESLASPMGAGRTLTIQTANDLITGVGSNADVLGNWASYDAGVVTRTVCARDGQHTVVAAQTDDDVYFFNNSLGVDLRAQLGLNGRIAQPFVFAGPLAGEGWIGFDFDDGARSVELYELSAMGPQQKVSLAGHTAGTLFVQEGQLRLASFQDSGVLTFHDVRNNLPLAQIGAVTGVEPSLLVSSSQSNSVYFAWQEGSGARRTIASAALNDTGMTTNGPTLVYPRSPVAQRDVKVSFQGQKGIAVWQIGNEARFIWVDHTPGTNDLTLGATDSLFAGPVPGELLEQAVAMGNNGALVLSRYRDLNNGQVVQPFFVARVDGSVTRLPSFIADEQAMSFDGTDFQVMASSSSSGVSLLQFPDGLSTAGPVRPLALMRPLGFDYECRAPTPCLIGVERQASLSYQFVDQSGPTLVDMLATQAPLAVTSGTNQRFFLAWRQPTTSSLSVSSLAYGEVSLSAEATLVFPTVFQTLKSARGVPPWLATTTLEGDLYVARGFQGAQFAKMINGRGMDLTSLETDEDLAVLGFTAFDTMSASMVPHVVLLRETRRDAGTDGGVDGGVDAGTIPQPTDGGGLDAGGADGGAEAKFELRSAPCGCDAGGGAFLALALVFSLRRRR